MCVRTACRYVYDDFDIYEVCKMRLSAPTGPRGLMDGALTYLVASLSSISGTRSLKM